MMSRGGESWKSQKIGEGDSEIRFGVRGKGLEGPQTAD